MVGLQLALRGYVSAAGYLYWDDFVLQSRAYRLPFPSRELLLTDHDGHLMPGGMAVSWLTTSVAPLSPNALTVGLLAMQLVASAAVLAMLLRVFGGRPLVLVPLAVYLFSPLTLPSFVWWSAALNALPLQAGLALAVWGLVGYLRSGRRRDVAVMVLAVVASLAFFEKAVLILPALVGVAWVLDRNDGLVASLAHTVRSHWRLWATLGAVVAGYLALYAGLVNQSAATVGSPEELARIVWRGLFEAVLPAVAGGPVTWQPAGYANAFADPPTWLIGLAIQGAVLVVAASCWARPSAQRAWLVLLGYLVADLSAIALGRGGTALSTLLPLSLRYTADAAVVVAFVVGVALMAPAGHAEPERARTVRTWLKDRPTLTWTTVFVVTDFFVLFSVVSTLALGSVWAANPARTWVENAKHSLAEAPVDVPILPDSVPESVLFALAYPENQTPYLLAPVSGEHVFAPTTTALTAFDATGVLVPARVVGSAMAEPTLAGCWPVRDGQGVVVLDDQLVAWLHTVHLGYLSGVSGPGTVAIGAGPPQPVSFTYGLHDLYVQATGGGSVLTLTLADQSATLCVGSAQVGPVVPQTEQAP